MALPGGLGGGRWGRSEPAPVGPSRREEGELLPDDGIELAHRATEELRAAATLMGEAQRVANFGSWEWRVKEDEVSWSDQLYRIFGVDPAAFAATFEAYLAHVHPRARDE